MLLLGVDFETTGLDVEKDFIVEVGAVVWCTTREAPIEFISGFINYHELKEIKPEITELNGIDFDLIDDYGCGLGADISPFKRIADLSQKVQYFVAHNARGFDRPMYLRHLQKLNEYDGLPLPRWIDTRTDVPYPKNITTRNLKFLLAEHGMLNPFPHRALTDALCMMTMLADYDINEVVRVSQTPNLKIKAIVSFDHRQLAKDRSFHWDQKNAHWAKLIKKTDLEAEEKLCTFPIKVLEEIAP